MSTEYKCRLCLNIITKKMDIFKDDFPKMIELISGLKINPNDGLLKTSCLTCARDVKFCMSIRKQILRSHKILCGLNVDGKDVKNEKTKIDIKLQNLSNVETAVESHDNNITDPKENEAEIQFEKITFNQSDQICDEPNEMPSSDPISLPNTEEIEKITLDENISTTKSDVPISRQERNVRKRKYFNPNNLSSSSFYNISFVKRSRQTRDTAAKSSKPPPKRKRIPKQLKKSAERVPCEICKKELKKHYLKFHMGIHFPTQFTCEICGATTKNLRGLQQHKLYWHTTKLVYICDKCGKKYRSKNALALHEKKEHGGIRDFECTICGKKFFQNLHLKRHIDGIHKKLRPHKCEYCGKTFAKRTHLVTHWRTHTNETPFICDMCGERFKLKLSLKSHLKRVHNYTEEEKFFCSQCPRGFATDAGLRAHINSRVHEGRKCTFCFQVFTEEYMQNHLIEVHGMDHNKDMNSNE